MSSGQTDASTTTQNKATVGIGDGPLMSANIRVASPGVISMSFRLTAEAVGTRLVGDLATVTVERTGSQLLVEIGAVSVMGYVEVCEASIIRQLAGPPLQGRNERRGSTRHRFGEPVDVDVKPVDKIAQSARGELGDLSDGGCGLALPRLAYKKVGGMIEAELTFHLPGLDGPLTLTAKRRNARAVGDGTVWIGMIWSRSSAEAAALKTLTQYLKTRPG